MKNLPCWLEAVVTNKIQSWYLLMQNEFDVMVVEKKDSRLMRLVAFFLGIIRKFISNVCSPTEFMDDFTTTIYCTVYVSFPVSELKDENYVHEISHMVHEFTHAEQFRTELLMPLKYLFSSHWRMRYEVEAYCRTMEYLIRTKVEFDVADYISEQLGSLQESYGVGPSDLKVAKNLMQAYFLRLKNGTEPLSELVTKAIEFWECVDKR